MKRFIFLTFGLLAVGFYELSGGSEFNPAEARELIVSSRVDTENRTSEPQIVEAGNTVRDGAAGDPVVTRAALNLVSFDEIAEDEPKEPILPADELAAAPSEQAETPSADPALPSVTQIGVGMVKSDLSTISYEGLSNIASSYEVEGAQDIRTVTGTLVNMRSGPGTEYDVVSQLAEDAQVEIISDAGNGWVELRPLDGGPTGWMADFLLTR